MLAKREITATQSDDPAYSELIELVCKNAPLTYSWFRFVKYPAIKRRICWKDMPLSIFSNECINPLLCHDPAKTLIL